MPEHDIYIKGMMTVEALSYHGEMKCTSTFPVLEGVEASKSMPR